MQTHPPEPERIMKISQALPHGRAAVVDIRRITADGEILYLMASNTYRDLTEAVAWAMDVIKMIADQEASAVPPIPADPETDSTLLDAQLNEIFRETEKRDHQ